jgi:hypothetical protein
MPQALDRRSWRFLTEWIGLSGAGLLGFFLALRLFIGPATGKANLIYTDLAAVVILGLVIPSLQALVLRSRVRAPSLWIAGSVAGVIFAYGLEALLTRLGFITYSVSDPAVQTLATSGIIGAARWLAIRRELTRPFVWIILSAAAWTLPILATGYVVDTLADWLVYGVLPFGITGRAIVSRASDARALGCDTKSR